MGKVITFEEREYSLSELTESQQALLHRTIEIAAEAKAAGNNPFGALLADENGEILMEQGNTEGDVPDATGHAETTLCRRAFAAFGPEKLRHCTLYSCCEPCCMCAGAIYWSNIGNLVYACTEAKLKTVTGDDPRNPTLDLPCRAVFACGQKDITVLGPFPELYDKYLELHRGFWNPSK